MHKRVILCVDDDRLSLRVIEEFLSGGDYELRFSHDGHSCLESVKEKKPDIILLDVELPGIKGFDICNILNADPLYQNVQIIFLTMLNREDVTHHCAGCKNIHVLQKPFTHDALDKLLNSPPFK